MKAEGITKKKVAKKTDVKTVEVEPFASVVDETPLKKRAVKKNLVVESVGSTAPAKKTVRKIAKPVVIDPFADVAEIKSSPVKKSVAKPPRKVATKKVLDASIEAETAAPEVELSPVFRILADVKLPELRRENRARLQMQTPTRIYFYWSVRENPWALLRNVFGDDLGSYSLVVKLIDKKHNFEKVSQCEVEGNWWFDVEPDGEYQAEIGFYAPNRPYFRVVYSNTVATPRRSPSPRAATESEWKVSASKFAEVLDVAGFSRDAFDVAMAGDDQAASENTSQIAFSKFLGTGDYELNGITAEDLRYSMLALASGLTLEELKFKVSAALFAILQANAGSINPDKAMATLTEYFEINATDLEEAQFGPAVFGASLVNFPRTLKTKALSSKSAPRYNPVGSHSFR